ncbi:acyltransferase family protein [Singulisphaera sp. PoT]|uniref:acyltransferase family protein n=1 Tax=Singulisphaera sp. PoT TaxID=3411797 RepID=UPI003BF56A9F
MSTVAESPSPEPSVALTKSVSTPTERLVSIDALRGFDMFWIIGGEGLVLAWSKFIAEVTKSPAASKTFEVLETQLEHVQWEGFHFLDLIFPLFLFIVGTVLPFSLGKIREEGRANSALYFRVARRALALFVLGLLANNILRFDFQNLRWPGVLQRIALGYFFAAILTLRFKPRTLAFIVVGILLGYWALLSFTPVPGGKAGDLTMEGNLAGYVDRHVLPGKIVKAYYGFGDNEGLVSTIPAVATALLGVLAGHWLRSPNSPWMKVLGLTVAGLVSLGVGYAWGMVFPIIKILWTSSFVLFAGGWSLLLLALFYMVIDVLKLRKWAFFFVVIGTNAITIYFGRNIIDFRKIAAFFFTGLSTHTGTFGSVVMPTGILLVEWLFLLFLYRRKIFLRV